jgi:hypothetical protein
MRDAAAAQPALPPPTLYSGCVTVPLLPFLTDISDFVMIKPSDYSTKKYDRTSRLYHIDTDFGYIKTTMRNNQRI